MLLVVVLAHLLLLQGMSFGAPAARTASTATAGKSATLEVRQIEPPMPLALPAHAGEMVADVAAEPAPVQPRRVASVQSLSSVREAPPPHLPPTVAEAAAPERAPPEVLPEPASAELLLAAAAPAAPSAAPATPSPAPAAGAVSVPVYATRLPPPVLVRYELKRGVISGTGELRWRPAGGRYQMEMEGTVFGINALSWSSQGRLEAVGLVPERFVDRRRGRDAQAANFQRDKGLITYSGASAVYPVVPGGQDRLSFMLQLASIVEAAPAKFGVGAKILLFVTGARGDADVWTFTVEPPDNLEVPAGRVPGAVHLRREPRKPYDTRAEVWLDPARSHLPVRVRLGSVERDDATDFLLREVAAP